MLQGLTTSEPDDDMIEVAIASVDEVFDWKTYIAEVNAEAEEVISEETKAEEKEANSIDEDIEIAATEEAAKSEEAEEMEMIDLEETEEDDEILQKLDYVFTSPEAEKKD